MKIKHYVNGEWVASGGETQSNLLAQYLMRQGWEVHQLFEIGYLVMFTPGFGEVKSNIN